MLKVHLDNNVASAISRRDVDKAELEAIDKLLEAKRFGKLDLGTSRQTPREMERAPSQHHAAVKTGLSELAEAEDDHKVLGYHTQTDQYGGCITNPLVADIVDPQLYSHLRDSGLDDDDAKHLMYAVHNGYQRFLTYDGGVLRLKTILGKACTSIQIQKPSELITELSATRGKDKMHPNETSGSA